MFLNKALQHPTALAALRGWEVAAVRWHHEKYYSCGLEELKYSFLMMSSGV